MQYLTTKYEVFAQSQVTFHSNKLNRDITRARLIGNLLDEQGQRIPCTADMAFDGRLDFEPKAGETILLSLSSLSTRGAMCEVEFMGAQRPEPLAKK